MIAIVVLLASAMVAALGAVTTFALMNSKARDEREAARVLASSTASELVRAKETIARLTSDLKSEQERADALDNELVKTWDHPDPAGARERVLSQWQVHHSAARGRDAVPMPASSTTATTKPNDTDLIDPWAGEP